MTEHKGVSLPAAGQRTGVTVDAKNGACNFRTGLTEIEFPGKDGARIFCGALVLAHQLHFPAAGNLRVGGGFGVGRAKTASAESVLFAIFPVVAIGALELFSIKGSGERGVEKLVLKLEFIVDEAAGSGADFLIAFKEKTVDLTVPRDNFKAKWDFRLSNDNRSIPEAVDLCLCGQRIAKKHGGDSTKEKWQYEHIRSKGTTARREVNHSLTFS